VQHAAQYSQAKLAVDAVCQQCSTCLRPQHVQQGQARSTSASQAIRVQARPCHLVQQLTQLLLQARVPDHVQNLAIPEAVGNCDSTGGRWLLLGILCSPDPAGLLGHESPDARCSSEAGTGPLNDALLADASPAYAQGLQQKMSRVRVWRVAPQVHSLGCSEGCMRSVVCQGRPGDHQVRVWGFVQQGCSLEIFGGLCAVSDVSQLARGTIKS
jgi:hypothetical protein